MAKRNQTSILVRMPKSLKRRLGREVSRRDSTLNDVAVAILADEFDVEFTPSGRRGPAPGESGDVRAQGGALPGAELDARWRMARRQGLGLRPHPAGIAFPH